MDLQRRDEFKQKLYDLTPADGKSIGNAALRGLLHDAFPNETFSLDDYWDLRNSLIADGKLEKGRGHGGSVRRVITVVEPVAVVNATGSVVPAAGPVQVVVAEAQCHLVFDRKFNMMETAADVTIEERSLGRGGKQVVKQMWWHCGVLVTSAVAEVQLQCTTMLVIAGRGQRRGFQRHPALSGSRHRLASSAEEDLRKGKCPPRPQISRG